MDNEFNAIYITLDGFVELHKYRYLCFVIIFTVYFVIICCNSIIVFLIRKQQDLHKPMYIFIAALLINSSLYSTNIYPKLLVDFLFEKETITYSHCFIQAFTYYILAGSEFLLLAAMAYDRYVSICKPLQYLTIMRKTTVFVFLVSAWLVPSLEMAVTAVLYANVKLCNLTLKGIFCNSSIYALQCVDSAALSIYGVFMLMNIALFPMIFIIYTYTRILIICYRSCKTVRKQAVQTCLPHLLVLINFSCFVTYDVAVVRLESSFAKTARLIMTLQMILYPPLFNSVIYGLKVNKIANHLKKLLFKSH
ncbi:olfactory receptor 6N2-like [Channa argus]|uniref:olfactory receptor 6N2-like n=1 Tax=Channa argus TaxID=215402 RepID=UPI003521021A